MVMMVAPKSVVVVFCIVRFSLSAPQSEIDVTLRNIRIDATFRLWTIFNSASRLFASNRATVDKVYSTLRRGAVVKNSAIEDVEGSNYLTQQLIERYCFHLECYQLAGYLVDQHRNLNTY